MAIFLFLPLLTAEIFLGSLGSSDVGVCRSVGVGLLSLLFLGSIPEVLRTEYNILILVWRAGNRGESCLLRTVCVCGHRLELLLYGKPLQVSSILGTEYRL
jgi:hypothetical protein